MESGTPEATKALLLRCCAVLVMAERRRPIVEMWLFAQDLRWPRELLLENLPHGLNDAMGIAAKRTDV